MTASTRQAKSSIDAALARHNAKFALNIAVSELQKYAGPDQRVTARADILEEYSDITDPSATVEHPYYTVVWDVSGNLDEFPRGSTWLDPRENEQTRPLNDEETRPEHNADYKPVFLVSGNNSMNEPIDADSRGSNYITQDMQSEEGPDIAQAGARPWL